MDYIYNDGGRAAAGFKGPADDCVCRAIAIVSGKPYAEVYKYLANGAGRERKTRGKSARNGIRVGRKWFKDYMASLGFKWVPTMGIGTGCKVHLSEGELPAKGKLIVSVSKHYTAMIDGVINDTHDPRREVHSTRPISMGPMKQGEFTNDGKWVHSIKRRCVYGYWMLE